MNQENLTKNLKILSIITLLIIIAYVLLTIGAIFMNLVTVTGIAIILAYLLLGPVNMLDALMIKLVNKVTNEKPAEDQRLSMLHKIAPYIKTRILSIFIVYISFFLIVIYTAFQLIPPAIYQISELAKNIPTYAENTINYLNETFPDIKIPGLSYELEKEDSKLETEVSENNTDKPQELEETIPDEINNENVSKKEDSKLETEVSENNTSKPQELEETIPDEINNENVSKLSKKEDSKLETEISEKNTSKPQKLEETIPGEINNENVSKKLSKTTNKHHKPVKKISSEHLKEIVTATASRFQNNITGFITNNAQNAISNFLMVLTGTLTGIGYIITALILSFYFILDGENLIKGVNKLIPKEHLKRAQELEIAIHESLFGFLKGQVLLGIATGVFMFCVYIIFDVDYSLFLSLFLAIAEIIPIIGSSLGFIPAIIVILITDPVKLPVVWLIFLIFQSIKDNIVAPKIVGEIIGLHPVTVMFTLWIGYQVAGFFGILFAIPIASVLNVIVSFIIHDFSGEEKEPN